MYKYKAVWKFAKQFLAVANLWKYLRQQDFPNTLLSDPVSLTFHHVKLSFFLLFFNRLQVQKYKWKMRHEYIFFSFLQNDFIWKTLIAATHLWVATHSLRTALKSPTWGYLCRLQPCLERLISKHFKINRWRNEVNLCNTARKAVFHLLSRPKRNITEKYRKQ